MYAVRRWTKCASARGTTDVSLARRRNVVRDATEMGPGRGGGSGGCDGMAEAAVRRACAGAQPPSSGSNVVYTTRFHFATVCRALRHLSAAGPNRPGRRRRGASCRLRRYPPPPSLHARFQKTPVISFYTFILLPTCRQRTEDHAPS